MEMFSKVHVNVQEVDAWSGKNRNVTIPTTRNNANVLVIRQWDYKARRYEQLVRLVIFHEETEHTLATLRIRPDQEYVTVAFPAEYLDLQIERFLLSEAYSKSLATVKIGFDRDAERDEYHTKYDPISRKVEAAHKAMMDEWPSQFIRKGEY